jgi:hypothetical protein
MTSLATRTAVRKSLQNRWPRPEANKARRWNAAASDNHKFVEPAASQPPAAS